MHGGVSSHSVVMTTVHVAKLGMMERTVRRGELPAAPPEFLFNWTSPEILLFDDIPAGTENDVYGLSVVLWEICTNTPPWADLQPGQIFKAVKQGQVLKPDKTKTPKLLIRVLREGLVWDSTKRDLDLEEIRDMLLMNREQQEQEKLRKEKSEKSVLKKFSPSLLQSEMNTRYGLELPDTQSQQGPDSDDSQSEFESFPEEVQQIVSTRPSSSRARPSLSERFGRGEDKRVFAKKYEQIFREVQLQDDGSVKPAQPKPRKTALSPLKSLGRKVPEVKSSGDRLDSSSRSQYESALESPKEKSLGNHLNVSSRSHYESALETPDLSTVGPGEKKAGIFMSHWRRERTEKPVQSSESSEKKEDLPQKGTVSGAIKFYQSQGLGVQSPLEATHYHSALSVLPSPAPAVKKTRDQTVQTETSTPLVLSSTPITGNWTVGYY